MAFSRVCCASSLNLISTSVDGSVAQSCLPEPKHRMCSEPFSTSFSCVSLLLSCCFPIAISKVLNNTKNQIRRALGYHLHKEDSFLIELLERLCLLPGNLFPPKFFCGIKWNEFAVKRRLELRSDEHKCVDYSSNTYSCDALPSQHKHLSICQHGVENVFCISYRKHQIWSLYAFHLACVGSYESHQTWCANPLVTVAPA